MLKMLKTVFGLSCSRTPCGVHVILRKRQHDNSYVLIDYTPIKTVFCAKIDLAASSGVVAHCNQQNTPCFSLPYSGQYKCKK